MSAYQTNEKPEENYEEILGSLKESWFKEQKIANQAKENLKFTQEALDLAEKIFIATLANHPDTHDVALAKRCYETASRFLTFKKNTTLNFDNLVKTSTATSLEAYHT